MSELFENIFNENRVINLPTLLQNDKVVGLPWMSKSDISYIKTHPSIEFILLHIHNMLWNGTTAPKIRTTGIGSRILVLKAATGSGKSAVLPPMLYKFFRDKQYKGRILVTEPLKATVMDIPYQIIQYNKDFAIGNNIGYQTGSISMKPQKGILFATIGILLMKLKILTDEEILAQFSFIIIDEVHKRSIELDTCLFYIKRLLERNWEKHNCPFIILMSATFDETIYMDFYDVPKINYIEVVGSSYNITDHFSTFDVADIITYTVDLATQIHIQNLSDIDNDEKIRDILIFIQGRKQLNNIVKKIHLFNSSVMIHGKKRAIEWSNKQMEKYGGNENNHKYLLLPISAMSKELQMGGVDYRNLFSDISTVQVPVYKLDSDGKLTDEVLFTGNAGRRVIIGTNAIETGMTIESLKYCIDTGFVTNIMYNPNFSCKVIFNGPVTQANSTQRRGRVGRKAPGEFYALYTKHTFDALQINPFSDIIVVDITLFLLSVIINNTEAEIIHVHDIKNEHIKENRILFQKNKIDQYWYELVIKEQFDITKLDLMQYPSIDSINDAIQKLYALGFITHEFNPTVTGMYANKFRKLSIESIRMILAGYQHGAYILDLITIACFNEFKFTLGMGLKYTPENPLNIPEENVYYYYTMIFRDEFIEFLFIWNSFIEHISDINKNKNSLNNVHKWAESRNLDIKTLFSIASLRDEILTDMILIGLNPFYNSLQLPRFEYNLVNILRKNLTPDGIEEIRKIKACIYEGYKMNLTLYDDNKRKYFLVKGNIEVNLFSKMVNHVKIDRYYRKPKKIIISDYSMTKSMKTDGSYNFNAGVVSVLDGYVDIDITLLS